MVGGCRGGDYFIFLHFLQLIIVIVVIVIVIILIISIFLLFWVLLLFGTFLLVAILDLTLSCYLDVIVRSFGRD